jgi:hypothetical protein
MLSSSTKAGISTLQGPHHVAQKLAARPCPCIRHFTGRWVILQTKSNFAVPCASHGVPALAAWLESASRRRSRQVSSAVTAPRPAMIQRLHGVLTVARVMACAFK